MAPEGFNSTLGSGETFGVPAAAASPFAGAADVLRRTHPWVRFMSIIGFISAGLMMVTGLAAGAIGIAGQQMEAAALMVLYPLLGLLYVFPSLYLLRFANRSRDFAARQSQDDLENALDAQRRFWKFAGIITVVSLCFVVLAMVFALVMGVMAAAL